MNGFMTLIVFICGFVIAQAIKALIDRKNHKKSKNFGEAIAYLTRSGGMPSGHAASFVGATYYLGLTQGFDSPIFALAVCMAIIVIYDAVNVRYAVGEHGKILKTIVGHYHIRTKKMRLVEGHTILEVVVGGLIGILIALIFWWLF